MLSLLSKLEYADLKQIAAIDEAGELTYRSLLSKAADIAGKTGVSRKLALLECNNSREWLIAYVALQMSGHATLLVPQGARETMNRLAMQYGAELEFTAANGYRPVHLSQSGAPLHPNLSTLLLTSGSTGSPKCVRLSYENISSNAQSIVEYLQITRDERGVVNLPVNYSYGMSIVNSHLSAGATLLLTERSVIEPEFWKFCRDHLATSFAGVPHTYDLLSRIDFPEVAPHTLRYFTQAGGRLATERALELSGIAAERDWRFYVMYGQTEAAPRMAYLPPDALTRHPGSIGIPIPGGSMTVQDEESRVLPPDTEGELVYEGPNVMMGYASSHEELCDAPGEGRLPTGDLAKITPDGYIYLTGRKSRFIKIFGVRIGLDDVERLCAEAGDPVIATGTDTRLLVVTREADRVTALERFLRDRLKLPVMAIEVRFLPEYPVLPTGKVDYAGLEGSITEHTSDWTRGRKTVEEVFTATLGQRARDTRLSFNDLNGDSLTFVRVSLELEEIFGALPEGWHEMPAVDLQDRLASSSDASGAASRASANSLLQNANTLRAIACLLVVTFHVFGGEDSGLKIAGDTLWRRPFEVFDLLRMPLFTALAGLVYAGVPVSQNDLTGFARKRFLILMVPAIAVSLIYFGIRTIMGQADPPLYPSILVGYLHLWFLYALFEMAIVMAAIDLFLKPTKQVWIGILLGLYLMAQLMPWIPFMPAIELAPFYILGMLLYRHPSALRDKRLIGAALILSATGLIVTLFHFASLVVPAKWALPVFSAASVIAVMRFMPRLRGIEWIGLYSYAIYLWHPAANAAVREGLQKVGLQDLTTLFILGTIAGVYVPIYMYRQISNWPVLPRLALIGRLGGD